MTEADVLKRVDAIRAAAGDDEGAHIMDDDLRDDLLMAIANGECDNPAACARAALATNEIGFSRWYA